MKTLLKSAALSAVALRRGRGLPGRAGRRSQRAEGRSPGAAEAPRRARIAAPRPSTRRTTARPTRLPWRRPASAAGCRTSRFKGDLRYRNENHRPGVHPASAIATASAIAYRLHGEGQRHDPHGSWQLSTTEGNDPRSSNQTLTDGNSRKTSDRRPGLRRMAAACRLEVHGRQDEVSLGASRAERVLRW